MKKITEKQMTAAFKSLKTVQNIMQYEKEHGSVELYKRELAEYCGILGVFQNLGLLNDWFEWSARQALAEQTDQTDQTGPAHTYGIVYADGGEQIAEIKAETMDEALRIFAGQMPRDLYKSGWEFTSIGSAPYIVTDTMIEITAFEY